MYLLGGAIIEWKILRHAAYVGPSTGLVSVDHSSLAFSFLNGNEEEWKRIRKPFSLTFY